MNIPIANPASYIPIQGMSFADQNSNSVLVSDTTPLPTKQAAQPAPTVLAGIANATGRFGPFTPVTDRPVLLTLSGIWHGTVRLVRSVDSGTSFQPLTIAGADWATFSGPACEHVWLETDPNAALYVEVVSLSDGAVGYRVSQ